MEPPRVVALDDEDRVLRLSLPPAEGLRGLPGIALALVLGELLGHLGSFTLRGRLALLLRSLDRTRLFQCGPTGGVSVQRRVRLFRKASPPNGGSTLRAGFPARSRSRVGEKAVDVVERKHPSTPESYRNLREAPFFPQARLLTQA